MPAVAKWSRQSNIRGQRNRLGTGNLCWVYPRQREKVRSGHGAVRVYSRIPLLELLHIRHLSH
jgi:hypothetical protein